MNPDRRSIVGLVLGSLGATSVEVRARSATAEPPGGGQARAEPGQTFASRKEATGASVAAGTGWIRIQGWSHAGDGGANGYFRVPAWPGHDAALRTADRWLPDGGHSDADGGWWDMDTPERLQQLGDASDGYASAWLRLESFLGAEARYGPANRDGVRTLLGGRACEIELPPTTIRIPRPLTFPLLLRGLYATSPATQLSPMPGATARTFGKRAAISINGDGRGDWIEAYPGMRAGRIGPLRWHNDLDIEWCGLEIGGPFLVERQHGWNMTQLVRVSGSYVDQVRIDGVTNQSPRVMPAGWAPSESAAISSAPIGDGLMWSNVHSSDRDEQGVEHIATLTRGNRGGINQLAINGRHHIVDSDAHLVQGGHFESGGLLVEDSNILVQSSIFFHMRATVVPPIATRARNAASGDVYRLAIEGCTFLLVGEHRGWRPGTRLVPDIDLAPGVRLDVRNARRSFSPAGTTAQRSEMGIIVARNGAIDQDWRSKAGAASLAGRIDVDGVVRLDLTVSCSGLSFTFAPRKHASARWNRPSGTYRYREMKLFDTRRMIGHFDRNGEISVSASAGAEGLLHVIAQVPQCTSRFLRASPGAAAGRYDQLCDVPFVSPGYPLDFGAHVNGFPYEPWFDGADRLAIPDFAGSVQFHGDTVTVRAAEVSADLTAPFAGVWTRGDTILFDSLPIDKAGRRRRGIQKVTKGPGNVAGVDWIPLFA
ncbi:hypothetical protein [Sphingomonas sp.]|uniref:hypothetical protein n=1 Tax=Sphingomonas sp. TaxID=28214 RepID=UPI002ED9CAAE